jgi:type IV pilus biogenesis protein CpaD/CtpE
MTRSTLCLALLALGLAPAIAGCEEQIQRERAPSFGPAFGNAVQNNMAVQIINPVPPAATAAPDFNGKRAESAIERYRAGSVIQPATTTLGTIGSGGPSGGGGAPAAAGAAPSQ